MDLVIGPQRTPPVEALEVEVVERKGRGHPDTICDALAENLSRALCRLYLERCGLVLHHNVDKILLRGGSARAAFGGGEVLAPIEIYLAGRATDRFGDQALRLDGLAAEATRGWLGANVRMLRPEHVDVRCLLRPGSRDLVDLYLRQRDTGIWLANDTSIGVGFAPLTALERAVLAVERRLNAPETKAQHPAIGEDIKVMGVRHGARIRLTMACAFIGACVADIDDYMAWKATAAGLAREAATAATGRDVEVEVNVADDPARGSVYLTVTGTSAEAGDDGETGRGNRANGLITPFRPMTMEAAAGKNPITHVGKLYQVAAQRIAAALVEALDPVTAAECCLVSQIGRPLHDPQIVDVKIATRDGRPAQALREAIDRIVAEHLAGIAGLWRDIAAGAVTVF